MIAVIAALALVLSAVYVLWMYQRMMTGPVTAGNEDADRPAAARIGWWSRR